MPGNQEVIFVYSIEEVVNEEVQVIGTKKAIQISVLLLYCYLNLKKVLYILKAFLSYAIFYCFQCCRFA